MTTNIQVVPSVRKAIYRAAAAIAESGPRTLEALYVAVDFGPKHTRAAKLEEAFETDWLAQGANGVITLTEFSRNHFDRQERIEKYIGTPAAPRTGDVFASQGLSKKNIPSSRGLRPASDAIPTWSQRPDGFGFKNIGGSQS